jgi:hypothetical protein
VGYLEGVDLGDELLVLRHQVLDRDLWDTYAVYWDFGNTCGQLVEQPKGQAAIHERGLWLRLGRGAEPPTPGAGECFPLVLGPQPQRLHLPSALPSSLFSFFLVLFLSSFYFSFCFFGSHFVCVTVTRAPSNQRTRTRAVGGLGSPFGCLASGLRVLWGSADR